MESMKKNLVGLLIGTVMLAGCAGNTPYPVSQYQPGDEMLSCPQIFSEIAENKNKILKLTPKEKKTGKNIALGAAGLIAFPAWFFMDFSDAERIEIQAFQQRNSWLQNLAVKKKCCEILTDTQNKN